jgi:hypothetical protein
MIQNFQSFIVDRAERGGLVAARHVLTPLGD